MSFADQLTVARAALGADRRRPVRGHLPRTTTTGRPRSSAPRWRPTGSTAAIARRSGRTSSLGSLLDPVADKLLVLATLIVLIDQDVFPAWMVAAIVARELLVSGLRQAAIERGVVIAARDLGKLKTWSQAIAAAVGGLAAAGAWSDSRRLVGAARRARADVGLGARLREVCAERCCAGAPSRRRRASPRVPPATMGRPARRRRTRSSTSIAVDDLVGLSRGDVDHSGMFPCLRGGRRSRFVIAVRSASISTGRVRRGSITSST